MTRTKLSIVIPTYLRPEASVLNDTGFLNEAATLGVELYLSDDSPDDSIERLFEARRADYANIHYRRNSPPLKHDRNVVSSLLWPDSRFTWILGDSFRTIPGSLALILDELDDQDFYFVNWNSTDRRTIERLEGDDAARFLVDRVWHQTLTGATIYHDRVRTWVRQGDLQVHPNFPHLGVILGYASDHRTTLGWHGQPSLRSVPKGRSYWSQRALDVFVDDWSSALEAHPGVIPPAQLPDVIRSHSANTRLFNLPFLLTLRASGHLSRSALRKRHFWDAMHLPPAVLWALVLVPSRLLRPFLSASRSLRARRDSKASQRTVRTSPSRSS